MNVPTVFVAILAKQKEHILPSWLKSLYEWDYPKNHIILYVRANNCTDKTVTILEEWLNDYGDEYSAVHKDYANVAIPVETYDVHEWNADRFLVLGDIRNTSVALAATLKADFYFVCDVDNFLRPDALTAMVSWNVEVVAPMLRNALGEDEAGSPLYSNFHNVVDDNGYFQNNDTYYQIASRQIRGLLEIDLVHCTYLIRSDVFPHVEYVDGSYRYEYVIFSDALRRAGIPQYLDNRQDWGCLTMTENVKAVEDYMNDR